MIQCHQHVRLSYDSSCREIVLRARLDMARLWAKMIGESPANSLRRIQMARR
jgi:hypothetical protein